MSLRVPSAARPEASVVVVTFGAWAWAERAFQALVEHTREPYELIVVDNGSGPRLLRRLEASVAGARVIRNPGNVGFGPACNQGAAAARGRHLVFLNSDALVTPGWLGPLMARADAGAGAVGPMLLNLDGSLQEAGAAVWHGGETHQWGAGEDPGLPEHRFPRTVDYVSGACLLVRRSAFEAVGGFDPAYAPAYYEDVDLCFALAARGMPAAYEPRSRVVHARGASSPQERALALVLRNRAIFEARWRARLVGRPPLPVPLERRDLLALRDAVASARILVLADRLPGRGEPAGRLTAALAAGWPEARVSLIAPEPGDEAAGAELLDLGVEAVAGAGPGWLAERAGHYDAILVAGRGDGVRALEQATARTQARAARIDAPGASRLGDLAAVPAEAPAPGGHAAARARELRRLAEADALLVDDDLEGRLVRAFAGGRPAIPLGEGLPAPPGLVAALAGVGVAPPAAGPEAAA